MSITRTRYRMQTTLTYLSTRLAQVKLELEVLRARAGGRGAEGGRDGDGAAREGRELQTPVPAPAAVRRARKRLKAQRDEAGDLVAADQRARQLEAELRALEETIRQFDPELDPSAIAASTGRPS